MPIIGFSTGALALGDFNRGLRLLEPTRADAVELSALRSVELDKLLRALPSHIKELEGRYRYISFHAPTDFLDERRLIVQLASVAEIGWNVIVHPDTIRNPLLWRELGGRLCLENMDSRKTTGRTAQELGKFFSDLPQATLCFDIAHARQVDATMTEAVCILSKYGDRLAQVHVSEVNSKGRHFAMSFGAKRAYEPFAAILSSVPIILESIVDASDIESEMEAAREIFTLKSGHELGSGASDTRPSVHVVG
jgi:hypothetical protein